MKTDLQTNARNGSANKLLFIFGVLIFLYTSVRAYMLSITWDEAYSYIEFVRNGILFPQVYNTMSANNHLLYTWLEIQLVNWFGVSELILRLPSLFAHALFLLYSYKLLCGFRNRWLALASFLILNLNPYMLDFFSLARGYGLSLGLMMASIYYLYRYCTAYKRTHAVVSILLGALAVLANYVLLNYCLVLFGVLMSLIIYKAIIEEKGMKRVPAFFKEAIVPILILALLLWIVIPIAFKLKEAGALFFGGNRNFWKDTFSTVTDRIFYEQGYNYWFQRLAKGFVFLVLVVGGPFTIIQIIKKKPSPGLLFLSSLLVLLGFSVSSTILQHYLLGTLYLMDRTALFLVVLFNLLFVFLINELSKNRSWISIIAYLSGLIVLIHFLLLFNLNYVLEWKFDAETKQMLNDLERIKKIPKEKDNVSISIPMLFDPSINFYRDINNLVWLNTVRQAEIKNRLYDYFYLSPAELATFNKDSIEILKTYPLTQNVLAKPKYKFSNSVMSFRKEMNFAGIKNSYFIGKEIAYSQGIDYVINDSITSCRNAIVTFTAKVMAPDVKKCNLSMVLALNNEQGCYFWQNAYIKDYIKAKNQWVGVYFSCMVPSTAKAGDKLLVYILNLNKHELLVQRMDLKWIEYN